MTSPVRFPASSLTLTLASVLASLLVLSTAPAALGQGSSLRMAPDRAERFLEAESFDITTWRGARYPDDRTKQVMLSFGDSASILAKWLPAPRGGSEFNNVPRYELAAYEIQKVFLEPSGYVVPPTACRCVPLEKVREYDDRAEATYREHDCALVTLQYWLWSVTDEDVFDEERFENDTAYAHHLANADVLTYLIDHKDDNVGNFLLSTDSADPRVFVVDNSVSFHSKRSNRGTEWGELRVERVPRETVERLRQVELTDLRRRLAVLAHFEVRGDVLEVAAADRVLDQHIGVRREDGVLQLGLEEDEIQDVYERIQDLLERVDEGDLQTF